MRKVKNKLDDLWLKAAATNETVRGKYVRCALCAALISGRSFAIINNEL